MKYYKGCNAGATRYEQGRVGGKTEKGGRKKLRGEDEGRRRKKGKKRGGKGGKGEGKEMEWLGARQEEQRKINFENIY